jgi:inosine-uridine nucleoside N-ribohydrolase
VRFLNLAERAQLNDSKKTEWHSADSLVTAITLDPSLLAQTSDCYNAVPEVQGLRARGSLFVDYNSLLKDAPCNVVIVERVDMLRYKRMLVALLT